MYKKTVGVFMKKILITFVLTAVLFITSFCTVSAESPVPSVSAQSAAVIEMQTGKVLFEKNAYEKRPIASTTKIMTTLLTLESGDLDEPFTVDPVAIKVEGSSMGLQEGDTVTKRNLCYGMLLPSGNDAANSAAIKLAGSFEAFSEMMNKKAQDIGMSSTYFVTPSGLDAKGHGSSAYDMALLAREAMKNPDFRDICSQQTAKLSYGNPPYDRWLKNTNKLLGMYDGCIGIKTGFTDDAGRCLVSAAERNGITLIAVTLKAPSDWEDHKAMLDYGFSKLSLVSPQLPGDFTSLPMVGGEENNADISFDRNVMIPVTEEDKDKLTYKIICEPFMYAPLKSGDQAGRIEIYYDNSKVSEIPIVISKDYSAKNLEKPNALDKIKGLFNKKQ